MFLITTALQQTWQNSTPSLFLGEWCMRYSEKEQWSKIEYTVLPYHWDDRKKLYQDFLYLETLHERLIHSLTKELNRLHKTTYTERYWRIIIGPWLGYFTQMFFDRWCSIDQATKSFNITGTSILNFNEESLIPNDMEDFENLYITDKWNHFIYSYIIKKMKTVPYTEISYRCKDEYLSEKKTPKKNFKNLFTKIFAKLLIVAQKENDVFLFNTYLPFNEQLKLSFRLKQFPQKWNRQKLPNFQSNNSVRNWKIQSFSPANFFEECLLKIIPKQIPKAYLEGYCEIIDLSNKTSWPKTPKLIFTSNSYNSDDLFKVWTAGKIERGIPFFIGQHGGNYGMGLWSFSESHQLKICDNFLSWGWTDPKEKKVLALGQLKIKKPLRINHFNNSNALLVSFAMPRQSYFLMSMPIARQWLDHFKDQVRFINALPPSLQSALIVRLYHKDYGWDQLLRWKEEFPKLTYDCGERSMDQLIASARIYISTYNATTYLESITMNVPTVIYWNESHWELRNTVIPFFKEFKRVGIFHETPESAAEHITKIWNNVDFWWNSVEVQNVLQEFKNQFCNSPKNLTYELKNIILKAVEKN